MARSRNLFATLLILGTMTAPVSAEQADGVLDRVVRIKPIVTAIIEENVLYATVPNGNQGRNDLAARVCALANRQDASISKVKIVDIATTRGGRSAQEWRIIGQAQC